jgi:hypothetical protein
MRKAFILIALLLAMLFSGCDGPTVPVEPFYNFITEGVTIFLYPIRAVVDGTYKYEMAKENTVISSGTVLIDGSSYTFTSVKGKRFIATVTDDKMAFPSDVPLDDGTTLYVTASKPPVNSGDGTTGSDDTVDEGDNQTPLPSTPSAPATPTPTTPVNNDGWNQTTWDKYEGSGLYPYIIWDHQSAPTLFYDKGYTPAVGWAYGLNPFVFDIESKPMNIVVTGSSTTVTAVPEDLNSGVFIRCTYNDDLSNVLFEKVSAADLMASYYGPYELIDSWTVHYVYVP